jgi:hypothetical protein
MENVHITGELGCSVSLGVKDKKLVIELQVEGAEFNDAEVFELLENEAKIELLKIINKIITDAINNPQYIEYEEYTVAE